MVKDQNHLEKTASFCLDFAKKLGATDSTALVTHSVSETVNFRNKKLDESERSDNLGITLTTYIGKKKSSISSSNLTENNIKTLIERCIETTKITPKDEFNSLPDKDLLAKEINDLNLYDDDHIENDEKIEYLKEVEDAAFEKKEIINTESGFSECCV
jgi:PmbA protein